MISATAGRSPRARGKPMPASRYRRARGSIPACAGKTQWRRLLRMQSRVDPRVRGENTWRAGPCARRAGRSPRARGKLSRQWSYATSIGSIPACAGKTGTPRDSQISRQVDPRVRGENGLQVHGHGRVAGRSPRARGKRSPGTRPWARRRSIPACAGKTTPPTWSASSTWVDPRVRGENLIGSARRRFYAGRSPRARGKRLIAPDIPLSLGSIPACAGKTAVLAQHAACRRVDPRVRGENTQTWSAQQCPPGRSPRARGKRRHQGRARRAVGSIPACAGKTSWRHDRR